MGKALAASVILSVICLSGCTTTKGSFCAIEKPLRYSQAVIDTMSDAEVADTLAHNEKGAKLCGWKP